MDKTQKFEYLQNVETYLENKQVFELLEGLLKQLIVHKPANPYDFLVQKLQKQDRKDSNLLLSFRVFSLKLLFLTLQIVLQQKESSLWDLQAQTERRTLSHWQSTLTGHAFQLEICSRKRSAKSLTTERRLLRVSKTINMVRGVVY